MIGFLRGVLRARAGEVVLVDVGGVGYEVTASSSVLTGLARDGAETEMFVYTDVRENAISLFGFHTTLEKQVFLLLRRVKGIGSRLALNIVSSLGAEGVLVSVGRGDITGLKRVSGVGKKTAERLIVELGDLVGDMAVPGMLETEGTSPSREDIRVPLGGDMPETACDAVLALERLGFLREQAQSAVRAALGEASSRPEVLEDAGELVKCALARIH